jgi:signal transduction histidine kinase
MRGRGPSTSSRRAIDTGFSAGFWRSEPGRPPRGKPRRQRRPAQHQWRQRRGRLGRGDDGCPRRRAVVTVANSGPPVPADDIDELFVPFRRLGAERTGNRDGLGLGLSIVKAIADAHSATVTVTPNAEDGLRIEVGFAESRRGQAFTKSSQQSRTLI